MGKHIEIRLGSFKFDLADITVEPVVFLYMFASFLYLPILQSLTFDKTCLQKHSFDFCNQLNDNDTFINEHQAENHEVVSTTSHWILYSNIVNTVPSFFMVTLFLGPFGDKVGRKIPILFPCFGLLFTFVSGTLNAVFLTAPLYFILIGPLINGFFGGFTALLMAAYSYVGHISSDKSKVTRLAIVQSMSFFSGTLGIFVSGLMLDNQGYLFVFGFLMLLVSLSILFCIVWIENIRHVVPGEEKLGCCQSMCKFLKDSFKCVSKRREPKVFKSIVLIVLAFDVLVICFIGDLDISLLYLKENFDFSHITYGYYKALENILQALAMVIALPLLKRFTSLRNLQLVLLGIGSYFASLITLGASSATWLVFFTCVIGMLKGFPAAGLRSTMSAMVSTDEQGRIFAIVGSTESVTSLLASVLFNMAYPATVHIYPGFIYMVAAGLLAMAFLVIVYVDWSLPVSETVVPYQTMDQADAVQVSNAEELSPQETIVCRL